MKRHVYRLCEHPGCIEIAVDRYRGKLLCGQHLNPDLPPKTAEDVVLVRSSWAPFDELERLIGIDVRSK